ncbi:MAG: hypothetical protein M3N08_01380 [Pseudomonadota bacterium]|nr:hypothetical protein [Pseudomonadota bacterium]
MAADIMQQFKVLNVAYNAADTGGVPEALATLDQVQTTFPGKQQAQDRVDVLSLILQATRPQSPLERFTARSIINEVMASTVDPQAPELKIKDLDVIRSRIQQHRYTDFPSETPAAEQNLRRRQLIANRKWDIFDGGAKGPASAVARTLVNDVITGTRDIFLDFDLREALNSQGIFSATSIVSATNGGNYVEIAKADVAKLIRIQGAFASQEPLPREAPDQPNGGQVRGAVSKAFPEPR